MSNIASSICEYYFNDIVNNNRVKNYITSTYDLSMVNLGTAITTVTAYADTVRSVSTFSATQLLNSDSDVNYSYFVNNSNTIKSIGNVSSFTVSFWVYVDNATSTKSTEGLLFAIRDTANNLLSVSQDFGSGSSNPAIHIGTTTSVDSLRFAYGSTNAFNHYAIKYEYSTPTYSLIRVYVNGAIVTTFTSATDANSDVTSTTVPFTIGRSLFNGNASLYILGGPSDSSYTKPCYGTGGKPKISNFAIFNTALTDADISNNLYGNVVPSSFITNNYSYYSKFSYNINNSNLLYYYPLTTDFADYKTGTAVNNTTVDVNITNQSATITAANPNTKFTNNYAFFGTSDVNGIQIPQMPFNSGGITIAFWAKINNIVSYPRHRLFECYDINPTIGTKFFSIFTDISGGVNRIYFSTTSGNASFVNNFSLSNNTDWHHYCVVISSAGVWTLYIDGVGYTTLYTNNYPQSTYVNYTIGSHYTRSYTDSIATSPKDVFMTQFVIFNRVITATELSYLVNYPSQVTFSSAITQFTPKVRYVVTSRSSNNFIRYLPEGGNMLTDWTTAVSINDFAGINGTHFNYTNFSHAVAYGKNMWVAGCRYETGSRNVANATLMYSYDGVKWNAIANTSSFINIVYGIEYANNMFVAVGSSVSPKIAYSYNGITWTSCDVTTLFTNGYVYGVVYKNSTWVAYGATGEASSSNLMAKSTNGINWTTITTASALLNKYIQSVEYNGSIWVAVGLSSDFNTNIIYSTNLDTGWISSTARFGSVAVTNFGRSVKWANGKFIAVGSGANSVKTSPDGITWTNITISPPLTTNPYSINYDPYSFVWFICQIGLPQLVYSNDNGITWISTNPINAEHYDIAYSIITPPCFLEGSKILSFNPHTNEEIYVPIEKLRKGDLIKTGMSGYVPISHIGWKKMNNPADAPDRRDRLYGLYGNTIDGEPLYLTGRHSTLHPYLSPKQLEIVRQDMGNIYVTENHYRLPTHIDPRAKPYTDKKPVTIWHFALEHENREYNYGVYANGLFVESTSIEYMLEQSNMKLLD